MGLPSGPFIPWPAAASWYLLGRHALVGVLRLLPRGSRRLWLPSYFCFDVADYWKGFIEVVIYNDDPLRSAPEWSTLRPTAEDIVIAVNYFGIRSGDEWRSWRERNECVLVEDHSHDTVSGWALRSNAEYAFASLRKTLPVPDGGILWSPRGLPLPASVPSANPASALKLAAMLWKRDFLERHLNPEVKAVYRAWQLEGECAFEKSDVTFATSLSQEYLSAGVPVGWRESRVRNAKCLLAKLSNSTDFRPIFTDWPEDAAPLGAVFELDSGEQRDALRHHLQENGIYCPVHWPATEGSDQAARNLAAKLLTIPTDQRYGTSDMEKIASIVTNR
jgi:hypothetical protein